MKRIVVIMIVGLFSSALFLAAPLQAATAAEMSDGNNQPSQAEMKQIMDATFGAMVPMMAKMTEVMIEVQLRTAEKPATAARLAVFKKNLYEALIKQGFSKEDAFQIMLNTSLPSAAPAMK